MEYPLFKERSVKMGVIGGGESKSWWTDCAEAGRRGGRVGQSFWSVGRETKE